MARIRTIKPEFFTSITIADLAPEQRLTFIGLWTHADDEGRCVDDARLIKAAIWPLDDRTAADVENDLRILTEASLITRYVFNGKRYLAVTNWREHQRINRASNSKLPAPEDGQIPPPEPPIRRNVDSVMPHAPLTEDSPPERNREQGTGNREQGSPPAPPGPPAGGRRGTRLPDNFDVSADMAEWAAENAPDCGRADHETFCDYWRSVPGAKGRKVDWTATWRNWMRREQDRRGRRPPAAGAAVIPIDRRQQATNDMFDRAMQRATAREEAQQ